MTGFLMNTTAQDVKQTSPNVKFGVVAGPNFSTFQSDLFNGNFRVGFHVGLMAEIELKNKWKLRPEFIYSQQGMVYKDGDVQSQTKVKYFNNYIDIPFLLEYTFSSRFSGYIGPGVGFLLKATQINVYAGNEESENVTDTYNRVDVGFYLGAEYYISPKFSLGLRFYSGFMYVEIGADRKKNFHFQIPLTYTF
ncbi:MAG: PorT family protein [Bacteroidales bacterium]|nr:PorT family protein [Bacteroidales bacterium]